jgi:hypothetical protein
MAITGGNMEIITETASEIDRGHRFLPDFAYTHQGGIGLGETGTDFAYTHQGGIGLAETGTDAARPLKIFAISTKNKAIRELGRVNFLSTWYYSATPYYVSFTGALLGVIGTVKQKIHDGFYTEERVIAAGANASDAWRTRARQLIREHSD